MTKQAEGWSHDEAVAVMLDMAAQSGADWGYRLFLSIADTFAGDASQARQEQAIEAAGHTTLALIGDTERIADELRLDPDRRRKLIADRVGACHSRLFDLAARVAPGGTA